MQVKKFEADSMQEALDAVKRDLGPEAVILQTKHIKPKLAFLSGGKSRIEMTAAVSERSAQDKAAVESRLRPGDQELFRESTASTQSRLLARYKQSRPPSSAELGSLAQAIEKSDATQISVQARPEVQKEDSIRPMEPSRATQRQKKAESVRYIDMMDDEPKVQQSVSLEKVTSSGSDLEVQLKALQRAMQALQGEQAQLRSLRESLSEVQSNFSEPLLQDALDQLILQGVQRQIALSMVKAIRPALHALQPQSVPAQSAAVFRNGHLGAKVIEALGEWVLEAFPTADFWKMEKNESSTKSPQIWAFLGGSGAGKTLGLAKVAAFASSIGKRRVALLSLERSGLSFFSQLATYAKLLNLPFRAASTSEDVMSALGDFDQMDLILVDTWAWHSNQDTHADVLGRLLNVCSEKAKEFNAQFQSIAVFPAHSREAELLEQWQSFSSVGLAGMMITKLDEARVYGSILNLGLKTGLPTFWFGIGTEIPQSLEAASGERLVSLLFGLK